MRYGATGCTIAHFPFRTTEKSRILASNRTDYFFTVSSYNKA